MGEQSSARASDQRRGGVLQHRVSLAVHDEARNHHGYQFARLCQHLRRVTACSTRRKVLSWEHQVTALDKRA